MVSKNIRVERTKRLNKCRPENIKKYLKADITKEELLEKLIDISKFKLHNSGKQWILNNCKNQRQVLYSFKLFLQLGLNNSRTYSTYEDMKKIDKYTDFTILTHQESTCIGKIYTMGIINDIVEEIEIRCFTVPVQNKCGKLACNGDIFITYPPIKKLIQNHDTYIKLYPQKPKNTNGWQLALALAIYSSVYNKILPSNYIVLGGITKEGKITPIETNIIQSINTDQSIIISKQNQHDTHLNNINLTLHYVEHINEVISLLKPLENNPKKNQKDFLCDR